jgi:hypothetical protein
VELDESSEQPQFLYTQLSGELELGYDVNLVRAANNNETTFSFETT